MRNKRFKVQIQRTVIDVTTLEVAAPTYEVAESRALGDAERGKGIWNEVEEKTQVTAIKLLGK